MRKFLTGLFIFVTTVVSAQSIERFNVNTTQSKVTWYGKKIVGKPIEGNIVIERGRLDFHKKKLASGEIVMNTTSIASSTAPTRLVQHLKNEDFFFVDKYPTATFVISHVSGNLLRGKMTIKGITHEMSFPVDVTYSKDKVIAKALQVKVDRTKYDIKYKSGNIFSGLGDGAIDDNFILDIELVAEPSK